MSGKNSLPVCALPQEKPPRTVYIPLSCAMAEMLSAMRELLYSPGLPKSCIVYAIYEFAFKFEASVSGSGSVDMMQAVEQRTIGK